MQKVSKEYRESMKSSLRERAYIMISFGLVNQEAEENARVDGGEFAYYSNNENIFGEHGNDIVYATLEENFTRVDGSMFFPPRPTSSDIYYDTGLIGKDLISEGAYTLTISFGDEPIWCKGLTIDFGENYPVDFDVICDDGYPYEFRDNTESKWSTEEVYIEATSIKMIFYRMKNPQSRLRIYSFRFGYGLVYYNDSVIEAVMESYTSPIGADIPQMDFSVKLKNYDHYFNVDNPKSAINFLETGQEMEVFYGYQLPSTGEIEWIKGNTLYCSEWESDDYTATIRCQDFIRTWDEECRIGKYRAEGISYYDLLNEVLYSGSTIPGRYIDPRLKKIYTKNPLPRVSCREALQIIANACRCTLTLMRNGAIQIKSNFEPDKTISCNGEAPYSNIQNVTNESLKDEYATLATSYTTVNGRMFFLPADGTYDIYTGYVSNEQSDEECNFTTNPVITVVQEAACMYYGVKFVFGHALPAEFIIRTYYYGEQVTEYVVSADEIQKTTVIFYEFYDFDTMEIEFTKTAEPYNRIVLNYFAFGDTTNFTMTKTDMTTSPKAIKQERIRDVIVPYYIYQESQIEETLVSEEDYFSLYSTRSYYIGEPSYGYRVTLDGGTEGFSVWDEYSYWIRIFFTKEGNHKLEIFGHKYNIVERQVAVELNRHEGKTIKWENPLIDNRESARELAEWLADYYRSGIEYEYSTRGNPEIDCNDIVYQENEFYKDMKVNIYRQKLTFKQAFSADITARRIGGQYVDNSQD